MTSFLSEREKKISQEFEKNGYIVKNIADLDSLKKIISVFINSIKKNIKNTSQFKIEEEILNFIHKKIKPNKLNNLRMKII